MRALTPLLALAMVATPSVAAACSWGSCGDGWMRVTPLTGDPLPRDGALVFEGGSGSLCVDALLPHVRVDVRHRHRAVSGTIDVIGGTGLLIFRPDEPWIGGARYDVEVTIDNLGLGGEASFLSEYDDTCERPAVAEFSFTASNEASPPLKEPQPPLNEGATMLVEEIGLLACCPGVTPTDDGTAGCEWTLDWPENGDCAYLYEETYVSLHADLPEAPPLLQGQVLHQLVVDGALADRTIDYVSLDAARATPTCARVESIHLGNGERQSSPEVCTSDEVAATLGFHLRDLAAELTCDAPRLCGDNGEWSTSACVPFDPDLPPTPTGLPWWQTYTIESECAEVEIPGGVRPQSGCGCTTAPTRPSIFGLVVLVALARRRRR